MEIFDREVMRPLMLDIEMLTADEFDSMSDEELFEFCEKEAAAGL